MAIVVECPHCDSQFNLQPDLIGKSMRCPNPDCREIFTVQPVAAQAPVATQAAPPEPLEPEPEPLSAPFLVVYEGEAVGPPPVKEPRLPRPSVAPSEPFLALDPLPKPAPVPVRADDAKPYTRVEEAEPLVPILEGEAIAPPPEPKKPAPPKPKPRPDLQPIFEEEPVVEAEVLDAETVGPKVLDWKKAAPAPQPLPDDEPPEPKPIRRQEPDDQDPELDFLPNRRGPGVWKYVLVVLVVLGLGIGAYIVIQDMVNASKKEDQLVQEAEKEFKNQNYPQAMKLYEQLQAEFPQSKDAEKHQFFGKLSDVHTVASAVIVRDNPAEGQKKFDAFLKEYADSQLIKPTETGFGYDVFEAGRKLVDAYADNAEQNLKTFTAGRQKRELLDVSEKAVADGRQLIPVVEKYRIKEVKPLDDQRKRFDDLTVKLARERERLQVIDPYRDLARDPTDQRIAQFVGVLTQARFDTDDEALKLIADAKAELRRLIRGIEDLRPPAAAPTDPAGGLLFVAPPLGQSTLPIIVTPDTPPEVFFANVRGILYAHDADNGNLLWAARVGRSIRDLPARFPERAGQPELVLVPVDREGFGLTARVARTGQVKWHQPLEGPIAGPPIVVNNRVYVPLRDELGTVVEIDVATGNRLSHVNLRQRIGPGGVLQPGSGMIFVAAEARRVFAINTEAVDADGNRRPLQCVQVLSTDHPELSLRVPPIITGPAGEGKANRYLVLAQADGTQATKFRAFPITPPEAYDPAVGPPEITPPAGGSVGIAGHVQFPPFTDGERIAVVTDAGAFGLFATNLPGNQDANIYALPIDTKNPVAGQVASGKVAGQVASGEEDTFWAVSRSKLYNLRVGIKADKGFQVRASGLPQPAGIPVQGAQLNSRRDTLLIVIRSDDSDGVRAFAFDPRDGRQRWQRKLGIAPPSPPTPVGATGSVVVDEDAGIYLVPDDMTQAAAKTTAAVPTAAMVAPPVLTALAPAATCTSADGRTVWVLLAERGDKDSVRLRVRRLVEGKSQAEELVQLADKLAGPPTAAGDGVVFPCGDGFLYRFQPGTANLTQGPMWRGEAVGPGEPCFVSPFGADEFLTTDGNRQVTRWRWAAGAGCKTVAGPWALREKIPFAPVVVAISANERRLFVADAGGSVSMYDADQSGEPLRRWRAAKDDPDNPIPGGKPSTGFVVHNGPTGIVVCYSVENRHIVAVSPGGAKALWVVRRLGASDTLGAVALPNGFLFTDTAGIVTAYDPTTGERLGSICSENQDLIPRTPAQPVGDGKTLVMPAIDGSVVVLPNPGL
ncbi:outer membrane protein assembly factor BamB family protein [Limnoglobus roseus]|uniref:Outer membrane protein assembly factor BamB n=1 Tax=Limnoglobus roseus TaxID=2598579 RepID=A0A5C1ACI4_9BACT|nr:PQQ-binding-like beta-propeller repeat protein [Limnoglobus roseus]QEL17011.1 Outer membrane protein assembly factor BamB [Limnoglobus roseus]